MDFDIADLLTTIVSGRARQVNQAEAPGVGQSKDWPAAAYQRL